VYVCVSARSVQKNQLREKVAQLKFLWTECASQRSRHERENARMVLASRL
jgi:hypothetical protein